MAVTWSPSFRPIRSTLAGDGGDDLVAAHVERHLGHDLAEGHAGDRAGKLVACADLHGHPPPSCVDVPFPVAFNGTSGRRGREGRADHAPGASSIVGAASAFTSAMSGPTDRTRPPSGVIEAIGAATSPQTRVSTGSCAPIALRSPPDGGRVRVRIGPLIAEVDADAARTMESAPGRVVSATLRRPRRPAPGPVECIGDQHAKRTTEVGTEPWRSAHATSFPPGRSRA